MALEYISSISNQIYLRADNDSASPSSLAGAKKAPIQDLEVNVKRKQLFRADRTGFRSKSAVSGPQREEIELRLTAQATGWIDRSSDPVLTPLLESALSTTMVQGPNVQVTSAAGKAIELNSDTSLKVGMALSFNNELRFIRSITGPRSIELNDVYTAIVNSGDTLYGCCNFKPGNLPRTFELFEFWSPTTAIQRVVGGACANRTTIQLNGDFVNLLVAGFAKSLTDSISNEANVPMSPESSSQSAMEFALTSPIAGHLGQAIMGSSGQRLCTLVQGQIVIDNGIKTRSDEFGCYGIKSFTLGQRSVRVDMTLYQRNDELSHELYRNSTNNQPTSIMLQLGVGQGNMMGIYLPAVLTPVPVFLDSDSRVLWRFKDSLGVGTQDDEIFVAIA